MIGLSPIEVNRLSMWEYDAAVTGWSKANNPDDKGLTETDTDALWQGVISRMN